MEELIANRYVNALVATTSSDQRVEFSNILSSISNLFDDVKVSESLTSPLISAEQKHHSYLML